MPIVNRFAKPPRVWPPPRSPEEIRDAVAFAEERDPIGTAVHLAIAVVFCASIALSTAMTSISFVLLVGYTALRAPNLWRAWMPLVASPVAWLWSGWMAWTALNAFWSADLERWRDSLGSFWCVALLPALYPLSSRWRLLLGAFIAGSAIQPIFQLGQLFGLLPVAPHVDHRPPGIGSHPGHVTTAAAMSVVLAMAWARETRSVAGRVAVTAVLALAGTGMVLAAGRGAILGAACGIAVLALSMGWRWGIPWSSRWLWGVTIAAIVAIVTLAGLLATGRGPGPLDSQVRNLEKREATDVSSVSKRYLWWQVSMDAFRDHPVRGIGTGSLFEYSVKHPRLLEVAHKTGTPACELATRQPHSWYMLVAAEQGLVGLGWLAGVLVASLAPAWRSTAVRPIACGLLAGMAVWLVASGFECLNLPLRTASMFLLPIVLASLPRATGVGLEPWSDQAPPR